MSSPESRAFVTAARAWQRDHADRHVRDLLRSPFARVPLALASAYARLSEREGDVLASIASERIAAGADDREALFIFLARMKRVEAGESPEAVFELGLIEASPDESGASPFALSEPSPREPGTGMRTRLAHFSASALNTYAECARKWYYRYLCAAVEDKGSSASFYGTAFHDALEHLHAEFPRPAHADAAAMASRLKGYVNASFDRHRTNFDTAVEYELQRRRAQRTARRYVEWLVAESLRAPFTVIGCELEARLELEGFAFVGYIDRLDRDDRNDTVGVLDYKTGSIATSAAEYRDKVLQFRDFQLPFYYWARTACGDRVTRLALIPLKDAIADVRPISLEVVPVPRSGSPRGRDAGPAGTISIADLERSRARMIEICTELTSGDIIHFDVTDDATACTYCAYVVACADRPAAPEDRFGR